MGEKLSKLEKQMKKLQAEIADEKKRLKAIEAKERKRKIELVGAYCLEKAEKAATVQQLVNEMSQAGYLKKPADRKLFA